VVDDDSDDENTPAYAAKLTQTFDQEITQAVKRM